MKKKVAIFGSTGSIGQQTLEVLKQNKDKFEVVFVSCRQNRIMLNKQVRRFKVKDSCVVAYSETPLKDYAKNLDYDIMVNALVGIAGFEPTVEAVKRGKKIALANKESLVVGGDLLKRMAKKSKAKIIPIDSEHSAILQCLQGNEQNKIKKIILTCSGGPFYNKKHKDLKKVTSKDALSHPNWSMGKKITIDSSTLMNKGFEIIEAKHLFDLTKNQIEVVIHRESFVHSGVVFEDGAIMFQAGKPDMKVPISYALSYPARLPLQEESLLYKRLTFEEPDYKTFKCLDLAFEAFKKKNSYAVALNAANEILVQMFIKDQIKFLDIADGLEKILKKVPDKEFKTVKQIMDFDMSIRKTTIELFKSKEIDDDEEYEEQFGFPVFK